MSSRELEERQEHEHVEWVAKSLGVSYDNLMELEWEVHEIGGNDGAMYGYRVEFGADTDPDIIQQVGGYSVDIGFPPDEPEPDQPE